MRHICLIIRWGGRDPRRPAGPVAIATLLVAICAFAVGQAVGDLDLTPPPASLFWLAVLGITAQSAGYLLISISLPRLPAIITSVILLSQPVMSMGLRHRPARGDAVGGPAPRGRPGHRRYRGGHHPGRRASATGGPDESGARRRSDRGSGLAETGFGGDVGAPLVGVAGRRIRRALVRRQVAGLRLDAEDDARIADLDQPARDAGRRSSMTSGGIRSGAIAAQRGQVARSARAPASRGRRARSAAASRRGRCRGPR